MKARNITKLKSSNTIKAALKKTASEPRSIKSENDYEAIMKKIEELMAKGSGTITATESAQIKRLALLAEAYEKNKYVITDPTTLPGIIEMKMFEMRLKQKDLATKLQVSDAKLSLILGGKQKPDIAFLKAVHQELHIDANLLLNAV